jgi:hypothetical protein
MVRYAVHLAGELDKSQEERDAALFLVRDQASEIARLRAAVATLDPLEVTEL